MLMYQGQGGGRMLNHVSEVTAVVVLSVHTCAPACLQPQRHRPRLLTGLVLRH
jgi:hypothetical protein